MYRVAQCAQTLKARADAAGGALRRWQRGEGADLLDAVQDRGGAAETEQVVQTLEKERACPAGHAAELCVPSVCVAEGVSNYARGLV